MLSPRSGGTSLHCLVSACLAPLSHQLFPVLSSGVLSESLSTRDARPARRAPVCGLHLVSCVCSCRSLLVFTVSSLGPLRLSAPCPLHTVLSGPGPRRCSGAWRSVRTMSRQPASCSSTSPCPSARSLKLQSVCSPGAAAVRPGPLPFTPRLPPPSRARVWPVWVKRGLDSQKLPIVFPALSFLLCRPDTEDPGKPLEVQMERGMVPSSWMTLGFKAPQTIHASSADPWEQSRNFSQLGPDNSGHLLTIISPP